MNVSECALFIFMCIYLLVVLCGSQIKNALKTSESEDTQGSQQTFRFICLFKSKNVARLHFLFCWRMSCICAWQVALLLLFFWGRGGSRR